MGFFQFYTNRDGIFFLLLIKMLNFCIGSFETEEKFVCFVVWTTEKAIIVHGFECFMHGSSNLCIFMVIIICSLISPLQQLLLVFVKSTNAIKDINKKKGKRIAVVINKLRTFPFVEGYALCHWSDQKNETLMWKSVLLVYESVLFPRHLNVFATKSLTFQICLFYLNWLNHIWGV